MRAWDARGRAAVLEDGFWFQGGLLLNLGPPLK